MSLFKFKLVSDICWLLFSLWGRSSPAEWQLKGAHLNTSLALPFQRYYFIWYFIISIPHLLCPLEDIISSHNLSAQYLTCFALSKILFYLIIYYLNTLIALPFQRYYSFSWSIMSIPHLLCPFKNIVLSHSLSAQCHTCFALSKTLSYLIIYHLNASFALPFEINCFMSWFIIPIPHLLCPLRYIIFVMIRHLNTSLELPFQRYYSIS